MLPDVLMHPNIPKPLHGVNPRSIMGQEAWDILRKKTYAENDFRCVACGVHKSNAEGPKWLEAHEYYKIDYSKGIVTIEKIVSLCHYCHNFIHSGRLSMILGKEKSESEVIDILEYGFYILSINDLECFPFTFEFANVLNAETFGVQAYAMDSSVDVEWGQWKLIYNGVEYYSKFEDYEEWQSYYRNINNK